MGKIQEPAEGRLSETTRIEAFSDGVFAIAITLLVLELIQTLHSGSETHALHSYFTRWEPYLAFLIGFLTILICWINHHHVFSYIKKTDSSLFWVNGFVLLLITFTPFPTAILAEYLKSEGNLAMAIFGFNYFLISLASYWICEYPYRKKLIDEKDRELFQAIKQTYAYSIGYTLLAFFVCLFSIPAAIVLYLVLFFIFAYPKEFALRLLKTRKANSAN